ncbi:MAG: tyrosine-protein phosphatase [Proteobacteria bacterium]|nr:tyrosine-protein phosphatase [Pseudomonadota bacterium]
MKSLICRISVMIFLVCSALAGCSSEDPWERPVLPEDTVTSGSDILLPPGDISPEISGDSDQQEEPLSPEQAMPSEPEPEPAPGLSQPDIAPDLGGERLPGVVPGTLPQPGTEDAAVQPAEPLQIDGLSNLYRVSDVLYRSAQPTEMGLSAAKALGIQSVLTLQLVSLDVVLEETEQTGLVLEHIPMFPWHVTENEILMALEVIRDAPKPVLVHCTHGADRTGVVIAMYRIIYQNWSREQAKAEMTSDQFGYHAEFDNLLALIDQIDIEDMRAALAVVD